MRRRGLFFIGLLLVWQLCAAVRVWPEFLFPSPRAVADTLVKGIRNGSLPLAIGASLMRLAIGYSLSLAIGLPLGLLVGCIRWLDQTVGALLLGLQTLPSICWLPLALLWFGLNERAIIFVVVMGAVLSVSLAAEDGVKNVPPLYLRAARNMGAAKARLYTSVVFPAAFPTIVTGMKLGWSFAWRALMAGELLYGNLGLGQLLMTGRELNDMAQVIAVMCVIVALGLVVDRLVFAPLERAVRARWGLA
ncbi:MAG: ABC transporter permease [Candidatus Omnitrophica bacterium]|nr:ABC transporter permease [Candidatus Omnitrophota bacterium]